MNSRVCVFHIAIEISYLSDTSDRPANANHGRMSRLESSYLVGGDISEVQHYPKPYVQYPAKSVLKHDFVVVPAGWMRRTLKACI